jgi:hypothetical protein
VTSSWSGFAEEHPYHHYTTELVPDLLVEQDNDSETEQGPGSGWQAWELV